MILGWTEHSGSGELHGTVAESFYRSIAEYECTGLVNGGHN
jgi:hypothetical protein